MVSVKRGVLWGLWIKRPKGQSLIGQLCMPVYLVSPVLAFSPCFGRLVIKASDFAREVLSLRNTRVLFVQFIWTKFHLPMVNGTPRSQVAVHAMQEKGLRVGVRDR